MSPKLDALTEVFAEEPLLSWMPKQCSWYLCGCGCAGEGNCFKPKWV